MTIATRAAATAVAASLAALTLFPASSHADALTSSGSASTTSAPSTSPSAAPGSFSLAISPTRLVVGQAEIGTTQTVQVINGGTAPMHVVVQKQNFTSNSDGALVFSKTAPYSASTWVTVTPRTFVVPPHSSTVVRARISMPVKPEPGDHQLALVFLVPAGRTSDNVRINRGIGMPVFITVPGAVDDSATITSLDAPAFSLGGTVGVTATIHDTGTVHRDFRSPEPLVVDAAGRGSALPFPDFTVMRGGIRDIHTTWQAPLMCICHLAVTVTDAQGVTHTKNVRVIVFPLVKVGGLLAGVLVLGLLLTLSRRRYHAQVSAAAAALSLSRGATEH